MKTWDKVQLINSFRNFFFDAIKSELAPQMNLLHNGTENLLCYKQTCQVFSIISSKHLTDKLDKGKVFQVGTTLFVTQTKNIT